jgi:hypothetical protein
MQRTIFFSSTDPFQAQTEHFLQACNRLTFCTKIEARSAVAAGMGNSA